jgi:predicted DNA-binding transcriptional regulator YafY
MNDIDISKTKYRENYAYPLKDHFAHAFGVINAEGEKPQTVQLKFNDEQGQYVKTYPLHGSQKLIQENSKEVLIEISVFITYDLIQELLSFGSDLEVLSPVKLRNEIKKHLTNTLKLYK